MNKKPVVLRTVITVVVIAAFFSAIHPLFERDYYDTFMSMLAVRDDAESAALVDDAKKLQQDNPQLYQSQALLTAAEQKGVNLVKKIKYNDNLADNRDVMSAIRKRASSSIRLGLDLNGGVEFILELRPEEGSSLQPGTAEFDRYRDVAIEILRKRLEGQKIFEAEITPSGDNYVALRAPVVTKDEKINLLNLVKMSAKLRFRLVHERNDELVAQYLADPEHFAAPLGYELMKETRFREGRAPEETLYFISTRAEMDGRNVVDAQPVKDQFGQRKITLSFNPDGAAQFGKVTSANVGRSLAIVLDGKLCCAPRINDAITGGAAEISGSFSDDELKMISDALISGNFPFQIEEAAVFDTDPKLGKANVSGGIWVGVLSLALVAVFMGIYYRLSGFIAVTALVLNVVLVLGAMAAFNCTLTLPGIAGIVLTIGMAVDANVLVFERIREELSTGKSLAAAVDYGYDKAFSAVFDANITTLISAVILMNVGTGAIKGFAVTLTIGILTSLFTALFVTRLIFDYLLNYTGIRTLTMMRFFRKPEFNFNSMRKAVFALTGAALIACIAVFCVRGKGMLGVDFTGGTVVSLSYQERVPQEQIEKLLSGAGYESTVTYKHNTVTNADELEILVRGELDNAGDTVCNLLNGGFSGAGFSFTQVTEVGGLIGWVFTKSALLAIGLSVLGIGLYVTLRYELTFAAAAVLALVHDVIVSMGVFLVTGRTISLTVVAAVLTVIGYSINDTVVIFDRVRELDRERNGKDFAGTVAQAVNQTLNRTLLTSITTFIVVFVLFLGGGSAINDFVLIMMLGIIFGTYSSVFISPQLALMWHKGGRLGQIAAAKPASK